MPQFKRKKKTIYPRHLIPDTISIYDVLLKGEESIINKIVYITRLENKNNIGKFSLTSETGDTAENLWTDSATVHFFQNPKLKKERQIYRIQNRFTALFQTGILNGTRDESIPVYTASSSIFGETTKRKTTKFPVAAEKLKLS